MSEMRQQFSPWAEFSHALQRILWVVASITLGSLLSACAPTKPVPEGANESYTASDVPEVRKRATNRLQLAVLYFQDGKLNFALDEVKQAIAIDPAWYEPYWMRGLIQMQQSDNTGAEQSFQKALAINPTSADLKHNYGVLLCKTQRATEGLALFDSVLATPTYTQRPKTLVERGNCLMSLKQTAEAEASYTSAYALEPGNPVTGYKLASLIFARGEAVRAQGYMRRINNSDNANAETLWLGIKIERRLGNNEALAQLGGQLQKRFATSREAMAYERGAFDE